MLEDVAPFGFGRMPLIYGNLPDVEVVVNEKLLPKTGVAQWCILRAHSRFMVFNIPIHHLEVNTLLRLLKLAADTKVLKMLNNIDYKRQFCRSRQAGLHSHKSPI